MWDMLYAVDAALTAHTETALQHLITLFAEASSESGLTISLKKTNIMSQDVSTTPTIAIGDRTLRLWTSSYTSAPQSPTTYPWMPSSM
jgi:hypothetical protein